MESLCGLCLAYEEEYRIVTKNDYAVVVVSTYPLRDGHLLITPRRHVLRLDELTAEESGAINEILYNSQQRLLRAYPEHPPIHAMQTGRHSSQPHIHYHMIPSDSHFRVLWTTVHDSSGRLVVQKDRERINPPYTQEKLEDMARKLRSV
ncbi:HIT family protein [Candidatus Woesearchaeota archaeon]|nr:HIT family protein [Candidatus Woesearchaeota archaeon]